MDCEKFNEFITEYEARRLTRKQELEFLHHKDVCEECNMVFNLVFNDSQIQSVNYVLAQGSNCELIVDDNDYCCSIMEKIQNIEQKSYNFKFYNILHIVFGVVIFGLIFITMFLKKDDFYFITNNIFKGTTNTVVHMSTGLSHVSNSAINSVEQCAVYLYVLLLLAVAITYLFSIFKIKNK